MQKSKMSLHIPEFNVNKNVASFNYASNYAQYQSAHNQLKFKKQSSNQSHQTSDSQNQVVE